MISDVLTAWAHGSQAVALLSTAQSSGYLAYLRSPRTPGEFAAFAWLPEGTAVDVLAALAAHGAIEETDGRYRLTVDALAEFDGLFDFGAKIEEAALAARRVASVTRTGSAPLTAKDALLVARAATLRPTGSQAAQAVVGRLVDVIPEFRDVLASGGRLLDVGSGVSGFTVNAATLFPAMRATTIELVPEVGSVAAATVKDLGLDDRVDARVLDAREFDERSAFDAAFWAQPYFPSATRPATLAMILRSLKPGGMLVAQQMETEPSDGPARAEFLLRRIVAHADHLPHATPIADVAVEMSEAGFEPLRIAMTDFGPVALAKRPL